MLHSLRLSPPSACHCLFIAALTHHRPALLSVLQIARAIAKYGEDPARYLLSLKYIEALRSIVSTPNTDIQVRLTPSLGHCLHCRFFCFALCWLFAHPTCVALSSCPIARPWCKCCSRWVSTQSCRRLPRCAPRQQATLVPPPPLHLVRARHCERSRAILVSCVSMVNIGVCFVHLWSFAIGCCASRHSLLWLLLSCE